MSGSRRAADRTVASHGARLGSHPLRRSSSTCALHGFIPGRTLRDPAKNLCAIQPQVFLVYARGIQVCPFIGEETRSIVPLVGCRRQTKLDCNFLGRAFLCIESDVDSELMTHESYNAEERIPMSYRIFDLELTSEVPDLLVSEQHSGLAVLVRYHGRPLAFWMDSIEGGTVVPAHAVVRRASEKAGEGILREKLREELFAADCSSCLPPVSIAVCTKDHPDQLARCLDSILSACATDTGWTEKLEIIVIDNAPSDERTREVVTARPHVRYVREPKPGLDFARNRALQEVSGQLLTFFDDDVVVDREWPRGLREACLQNPEAAAFTGLILPYELVTESQILFERVGGFRTNFDAGFESARFGRAAAGSRRYPYEAGVFGAGANMTFRRDVLLQLGGFDDALDTGGPLPGGGDLDIFCRVIRAGHRLVYEPRCLVFHEHPRTPKQLKRQFWSWGIGFMAFVGKLYQSETAERPKLRRLVGWWFRHHLTELFASLRAEPKCPPRFVAQQIWGGIMGLCGEYARSRRRIAKVRAKFE
jgi:glycosyltransferase involved in cell wall biosynthesis